MTGGPRQSLLSNGCAKSLLVWLKEEAQVDLNWGRRALLSYNAFWFEQFLAHQQPAHTVAPEIRLVMGFWRSGTTLLHNLLHESYDCATPTSWQCFNPATCFVRQPPTQDRVVVRPMDDGLIRLLGPQEDEFALLLLGEPSLYRGFFAPEQLPLLLQEQLTGAHHYSRWKRFIAAVASDTQRPVLLKSPNHYLRLDAISEGFSNRKFVWIARDFRNVYFSNLKMWQAMASAHGLAEWNTYTINAFVVEAMECYRNVIAAVPKGHNDHLWISFDALVNNTEKTVSKVAEFLGIYSRKKGGAKEPINGMSSFKTDQYLNLTLAQPVQDIVDEVDNIHASLILDP